MPVPAGGMTCSELHFTMFGTDPAFTYWMLDDRVAVNSEPFGAPPGVGSFVSGAFDVPVTGAGDEFGVLQPDPGNETVIGLPEPSGGVLFAVGAVALGGLQRRRRLK